LRERVGDVSKESEKKNRVTNRKEEPFKVYQSGGSPVDQILYLQRTIGNRAVTQLIASGYYLPGPADSFMGIDEPVIQRTDEEPTVQGQNYSFYSPNVRHVFQRLDEERWDVDSLAAALTDSEMMMILPEHRLRLIAYIARGSSVGDEDEQTIIRLLATTSSGDANSVLSGLEADNASLLEDLQSAIDFGDYEEYHQTLRNLFFAGLEPREASSRMLEAREFPWADPGIIEALWKVRFYYDDVSFNDDGNIHVSYWTNFAAFGMRTQDTTIDPFEMIAVRFYHDEESVGAAEGDVIYMPAVNLMALHSHQFKRELQLVADIALLGLGGTGIIRAGSRAARLIAALEVLFAAADVAIREFRHEIGRSEGGREFLGYWDHVSTLIAVYTLARVVIRIPSVFRNLRDKYSRFRTTASNELTSEQLQRMDDEISRLINKADEAAEETRIIQRAGPSPERVRRTLGTFVPQREILSPHRRHFFRNVLQGRYRSGGPINTVIEPGVDVAADVRAINAGQATRLPDNNILINQRVYGIHTETRRLFPIEGVGFHQLSAREYNALGVLNKLGDTASTHMILSNMGVTSQEKQRLLELWRLLRE
jgi:hypothetical protein